MRSYLFLGFGNDVSRFGGVSGACFGEPLPKRVRSYLFFGFGNDVSRFGGVLATFAETLAKPWLNLGYKLNPG